MIVVVCSDWLWNVIVEVVRRKKWRLRAARVGTCSVLLTIVEAVSRVNYGSRTADGPSVKLTITGKVICVATSLQPSSRYWHHDERSLAPRLQSADRNNNQMRRRPWVHRSRTLARAIWQISRQIRASDTPTRHLALCRVTVNIRCSNYFIPSATGDYLLTVR